MTTKEQESVDKVYKLLAEIRTENNNFREEMKAKVDNCTQKVDKKVEPLYFEEDILNVTKQSVQKAIQEALTKYDSPLVKLVGIVINEHSTELKTLISDSFEKAIRTEDFKDSILDGFSHKVARTIISNNDGLFEKVTNDLRQDPVFKSKMVVAVANIVNECLIERK